MEFAIRNLSFDRYFQCHIFIIHVDVSNPTVRCTFYYYEIDDDDQICEIQLRIQLLPIHQRTNPKAKAKNSIKV